MKSPNLRYDWAKLRKLNFFQQQRSSLHLGAPSVVDAAQPDGAANFVQRLLQRWAFRADRYKWSYGAPINGLINGYLGLQNPTYNGCWLSYFNSWNFQPTKQSALVLRMIHGARLRWSAWTSWVNGKMSRVKVIFPFSLMDPIARVWPVWSTKQTQLKKNTTSKKRSPHSEKKNAPNPKTT